MPEADVRQLFARNYTASVLPAVPGYHPDGSVLNKIPSDKGSNGIPHRTSGWPDQQTTLEAALRIAADAGLNMLCRLDMVRVIDIDVPDPVITAQIIARIEAITGCAVPVRYREGTGKASAWVRVVGNRHMQKAVLTIGATEGGPKGAGAVELLGQKQQSLVCGVHENGSRYYWRGLDVSAGGGAFPEITEEQLLAFYAALVAEGATVVGKPLLFGEAPERFEGVAGGVRGTDPLSEHAITTEWIDGSTDRGWTMRCPWQHEHTDGARGDPSSTILLYSAQGSDGAYKPSRFVCAHGHCQGRTTRQAADAIGFTGPLPGDKSTPADTSAFTGVQAPPGAYEAQLRGERTRASLEAQQAIEAAQASSAAPNLERYRLKRGAEILAAPLPSWAVDDVLPDVGIAMIYGASGCGKSLLVWDVLPAVARGDVAWMGHDIPQARPVAYLMLEGEGGLSLRARALGEHTGRPLPENFGTITNPVHLANPADVRDLIAALRAQGLRDGIVCIDTLACALPGVDENAAKEVTLVMEAVKQIQRELGGLVLLIAHSGKDATKGPRGSSALFAAMDAVIEVRREGEMGELRSWKVTKAKDGEDGISGFFRLLTVPLGVRANGKPIRGAVVVSASAPDRVAQRRLGGAETLALATLTEVMQQPGVQPSQGVRLEDWRTLFYARSTGDKEASKRQSFHRAREALVSAGRVQVNDDHYRLSSPPDVQHQPSVGAFTATPRPAVPPDVHPPGGVNQLGSGSGVRHSL